MQNKKKWVKNQQPIRYNNQKQVIDLMRSGSQSCSDIAKATGLSNTAAENIVDEMVEMGVLVRSPITVNSEGVPSNISSTANSASLFPSI